MPRFHSPLIEPDGRFSRIRLSDKNSRFRPREGVRPGTQADQTQFVVQVPVGESCQSPVLHLVLAHNHRRSLWQQCRSMARYAGLTGPRQK